MPGRPTSLKAAGDREWLRVHKVGGLEVDHSSLKITSDDKAFRIHTIATDLKGHVHQSDETLDRVGRGTGLAGTWRSTAVGINVSRTVVCERSSGGRHLMMHPGLAALKGRWNKAEYAAGFRARFSAIPDSEQAHHCWRVGWKMLILSCWSRAGIAGSLRRAGKTTTRIPGAFSSTLEAMRGEMAYRLMMSARFPGKRAGSMPTSTLGFMGLCRCEEGRTEGDALRLREPEDTSAGPLFDVLHPQASG